MWIVGPCSTQNVIRFSEQIFLRLFKMEEKLLICIRVHKNIYGFMAYLSRDEFKTFQWSITRNNSQPAMSNE